MDKLIFGTAGIPISTHPRNTSEGIKRVKELGLGAMELEFVRSVNISKEKAPLIKEVAKKNNIVLTCHAPYYVNLNSADKAKLKASIERILKAARIANLCGACSVTFHPGFYQQQDPKKVYDKIKKQIQFIVKKLKNENNKIMIRPETTGKATQFGSIEELVKLSSEISQVQPCIDFSHLHARTGKINSYKEFCDILSLVKKVNNMHIHVSGIAYSAKGEKHHLTLKESDFKYKELMKALKKFKAKGVVISESPNIEKDALLLKRSYSQ